MRKSVEEPRSLKSSKNCSFEVAVNGVDQVATTSQKRQRGQFTDESKRSTESPETDSSSSRKTPSAVTSRVSAEWSGATGGPPAQVVLRLHPTPTSNGNFTFVDIEDGGVVVRAEEALIVTFVLLLWVAAIALFFNRWGKIRCVYKLMLEPYQPKFQQQHRQSCVLAENSVSVPPHHRASVSRACVSYDYGTSTYQPYGYISHRPRQNSVFVGSVGGGMALIPESPPRRSRSAADLPALVPPVDISRITPRTSRAASMHSAVDLRVCVPSPRTARAASLHSAVEMPSGSVQVHVRGSGTNLNRPRSPRRLTITNV
ncbi:uncharacterized protein [Battus philenor]|uniref:uncharacterized protein n=1 Tax=Battus philenor TaxID=42288 RepID=UPI0035CFB172